MPISMTQDGPVLMQMLQLKQEEPRIITCPSCEHENTWDQDDVTLWKWWDADNLPNCQNCHRPIDACEVTNSWLKDDEFPKKNEK